MHVFNDIRGNFMITRLSGTGKRKEVGKSRDANELNLRNGQRETSPDVLQRFSDFAPGKGKRMHGDAGLKEGDSSTTQEVRQESFDPFRGLVQERMARSFLDNLDNTQERKAAPETTRKRLYQEEGRRGLNAERGGGSAGEGDSSARGRAPKEFDSNWADRQNISQSQEESRGIKRKRSSFEANDSAEDNRASKRLMRDYDYEAKSQDARFAHAMEKERKKLHKEPMSEADKEDKEKEGNNKQKLLEGLYLSVASASDGMSVLMSRMMADGFSMAGVENGRNPNTLEGNNKAFNDMGRERDLQEAFYDANRRGNGKEGVLGEYHSGKREERMQGEESAGK
jgi:hypothetical protein